MPHREFPGPSDCISLQRPAAVHGSAPDIAGQDKANPTALLMSAIEMLNYIGEQETGMRIKKALFATLEASIKTSDLGGTTKCSEFTDEIIKRL